MGKVRSAEIWSRRPYEGSSLLHGWIPHLQVALDACQRRLLQDEFSILRRLSLHGRPVVRTHQQPLVDEDGIFGFRMERLIGINSETAAQYIPEIEKAIDSIHQCGVVVHDISPGNIMLNQQGCVTIIDFGRAGHAGETIPPWKTIRTKTTIDEVFSVDADRLALGKTAGMETLLRKYDLATHDQLIGIISRTARLDE